MRRVAVALAAAVVVLSGCSSGEGSAGTAVAKPAVKPERNLYAKTCSKDVKHGLRLYWGAATGMPVGVDESQEAAAVLVKMSSKPEWAIYEDYQRQGIQDMVQMRQDGKKTRGAPAELLAKYGSDIDRDCDDAYAD